MSFYKEKPIFENQKKTSASFDQKEKEENFDAFQNSVKNKNFFANEPSFMYDLKPFYQTEDSSVSFEKNPTQVLKHQPNTEKNMFSNEDNTNIVKRDDKFAGINQDTKEQEETLLDAAMLLLNEGEQPFEKSKKKDNQNDIVNNALYDALNLDLIEEKEKFFKKSLSFERRKEPDFIEDIIPEKNGQIQEDNIGEGGQEMENKKTEDPIQKAELSKKRLGRGLAALIGDATLDDFTSPSIIGEKKIDLENKALQKEKGEIFIQIENLRPNPQNPRRNFSEEEIQNLAQSIKEHGVLQPILVRKDKNENRFQIIAGERRWRAASFAGLEKVPVIIRDVEDKQALEIAIIENIQRFDLNPLEEALGYQQLIDEYKYKQEDLAQILGKSRSHVTNILRLLKLPIKVQKLLQEGALSNGHARALVNVAEAHILADKIVEEGLSVRQTEVLVQEYLAEDAKKHKKSRSSEEDEILEGLQAQQKEKAGENFQAIERLENLLKKHIQAKFTLKPHQKNKGGVLKIEYKSLEEIDAFCALLSAMEGKKE